MVPDGGCFERRFPGGTPCCWLCWEVKILPGDKRSSNDWGVLVNVGANGKLCTSPADGVVGDDSNCVNLSV